MTRLIYYLCRECGWTETGTSYVDWCPTCGGQQIDHTVDSPTITITERPVFQITDDPYVYQDDLCRVVR